MSAEDRASIVTSVFQYSLQNLIKYTRIGDECNVSNYRPIAKMVEILITENNCLHSRALVFEFQHETSVPINVLLYQSKILSFLNNRI